MSHSWGNVSIIRACLIHVSFMSHSWENISWMRECLNHAGMSNSWGKALFMRKCVNHEGMSQSWGNVSFNVYSERYDSQFHQGMSHSWGTLQVVGPYVRRQLHCDSVICHELPSRRPTCDSCTVTVWYVTNFQVVGPYVTVALWQCDMSRTSKS